MRVIKAVYLLFAAVMLMGFVPPTTAAGPETIEPALLRLLQAGEPASFIVEMAVQADLDAVPALDWAARGRSVWQAVNDVARATQAPVLAVARRHGLEAESLLAANAVYVRRGTLAAARDLAALPGVARLRPEHSRPLAGDALPSPQAVTSWGLIDAGAPDVWAMGVRGTGAWVAEIGTGVQWTHPALVGNYGCPDDPGSTRCWYDPGNVCGGLPCDNNGHGTFMMGVMVAEDDPGLAYIAGMAPDAAWIACKGCESSSCSDYALLSCGDWVLAPGGDPDNRPHVVLNPWGGGAGGNTWYRGVVTAWVAAGIMPVFTAGNGGPSCATLGSPCDYPESFCVTGYDENRNATTFSSRGPGAFGHDPYTKPNISAPATNLWSTYPTDTWINWNSTAGAAAHAAGAAALAVSGCPELAYDAYALFELLQDNADTPPDGACGAPPDGQGNYTFGYGYLNALAAVEACYTPPQTVHLSTLLTIVRPARPGWHILVAQGRVHDQDHAPLAGVSVTVVWTLPDGTARTLTSAPSTAEGRWSVRGLFAQCGLYQLDVTGLAAVGYIYDPAANDTTTHRDVTVACP